MLPILLKLQLNTPTFKYVLILLMAPLWLPFLRELWRELNRMLEEEGGLLGRTPSERELQEIRARRRTEDLALVRELRLDSAPARTRPLARRGFAGQTSESRRGPAGRSEAPPRRPRGFGSSRP